LDLPIITVAPGAATPAATPVPLFTIGDTIAMRAGVITDHNGNPVPDGTVVHFSMVLTGEGGGILQQADAVTTDGVAHVSFGLDKPGLLQIRASSDPAQLSEVLQLDVSGAGQPAAVTVIVPAITPETAPPALQTPEPRQDAFVSAGGAPRFSAWLLALLLLAAGVALVVWTGRRTASTSWAIRWGLCTLIGGLTAYNYFAIGLPGSAEFALSSGVGGILSVTLAGLAIGYGAGQMWWRRSRE
jgi:beta-N-acetylhexosaminidase